MRFDAGDGIAQWRLDVACRASGRLGTARVGCAAGLVAADSSHETQQLATLCRALRFGMALFRRNILLDHVAPHTGDFWLDCINDVSGLLPPAVYWFYPMCGP